MEFGPHNPFSDPSFGGPNIPLVRIQLGLDSMIENLGLFEYVRYMGEGELPAILQSRSTESVF